MHTFEERLGEIIEQLPTFDGIKIKYQWGNEDVLKKYLIKNQSAYPLIWLVNGKRNIDNVLRETQSNCMVIICNLSKNPQEFNPVIYQRDYKFCINPITDNFIHALETATISTMTKNYSIEDYPNYLLVGGDKQSTLGIWNARAIDLDLKFNNNCLRTIIF